MAQRSRDPRADRQGEPLTAAIWVTQATRARLRALALAVEPDPETLSWTVTQLIQAAYEARGRKGGVR